MWKTSIIKRRGLDRGLLRSLAAESEWVKQHFNLILIGAAGVEKAGWPPLWRIKPAVTATRFTMRAPHNYFASWRWRMPMAASAGCSGVWRKPTCW